MKSPFHDCFHSFALTKIGKKGHEIGNKKNNILK